MVTIEEFRRLELKVAKILEAQLHPNAQRLLVLKVDSGGTVKEIVSGIAQHYPPESLVGKQVVIVDNLEPAIIRGVTSSGMVLATQDGEILTLVVPEKVVTPGSIVK